MKQPTEKIAILLTLMIGFDLTLHIADLLNIVAKHPLYPIFPILYGLISYSLFWTVYWTIGFILAFLLIFSGVKITTKNYFNIPEQDSKKLDRIEDKLNKLEEK